MTEQQRCATGAAGQDAARNMAMDLIRHIAGLYSGKAIKGDFTQVYITGNEIWMAQQVLASQQAEGAQGERQALPYWEPCNPGCDPEFNGQRSKHCAQICHNARAALAQPCPAPELETLEAILDDVCGKEGGLPVDTPIYTISLNEIAEAFSRWQARPGAEAPERPELEKQEPVAFRLLNQLGEVMTEWRDGTPPERFSDPCGNTVTDVRVQVAYAEPVAQAQARQVPDGWKLVPIEPLINMMSDKDHDTRIMAERQLLAILAADSAQGGSECKAGYGHGGVACANPFCWLRDRDDPVRVAAMRDKDMLELREQNAKLEAEAQALRDERDSQQRVAIRAMEEVSALRARVVVVPSAMRPDGSFGLLHHFAEGWNECLSELAKLNGKVVSMADISACLDAELREWTGDHRKAVEVALTDANGRIMELLGQKEGDGHA